jgi:hypothetical protein
MGLLEDAAGAATGSSTLPWAILGAVVAIGAAAVGGYFYGHHVEALAFSAYQSAQAAAAEKQAAANKTALLAQQSANQAAMTKTSQTYAGEIDEITKRRDALIAANNSLTQRLYVHVASPSSAKPGVPETGASGPVDASASEVELPQQLNGWITDRFAEADRNAALVTSLQQVIVEDRLICNGQLPGITQTDAKK